MNKLQSLLVKTAAKMLLNEEQEISVAKLGGNIVAIAGVVLSMPSMGFHVGVDIINVAKLVIALGGAMGFAGMRDAITKGAK